MLWYAQYSSPVGNLLLLSDGASLTGLYMDAAVSADAVEGECPVFRKAERWLDAYFRGENPKVDFPLAAGGTEFQKQVWQLLTDIPYGCTCSYGEFAGKMAAMLGKEKMSPQAVGQAVGANPISILVPCHRVVGAKGQLTGYAGGTERKRWLLEHERKHFT